MEDQPCTRVRARQWSRLRERVAKTQALNFKDGSPGDFIQSVVHTQQTGVSGGHRGPPKTGGEIATVDQQKAEWGRPFKGHERPEKDPASLTVSVSLRTRNQHLLAYLKTTPVVIL